MHTHTHKHTPSHTLTTESVSPTFIMEEQHAIEVGPDREPDWWDEQQERNNKRKKLGLSNDMCDFLDELMQRQGKAGDEEERKRKDDANKDKLVENAEKEGLVTLGPVSLEKRRERDEIEEQWAENAEKEGLVTPGLVSLEKRREREGGLVTLGLVSLESEALSSRCLLL